MKWSIHKFKPCSGTVHLNHVRVFSALAKYLFFSKVSVELLNYIIFYMCHRTSTAMPSVKDEPDIQYTFRKVSGQWKFDQQSPNQNLILTSKKMNASDVIMFGCMNKKTSAPAQLWIFDLTNFPLSTVKVMIDAVGYACSESVKSDDCLPQTSQDELTLSLAATLNQNLFIKFDTFCHFFTNFG